MTCSNISGDATESCRTCTAGRTRHGLFIRHMLRGVEDADIKAFVPDCTVIDCPEFKADPSRRGRNSDVVVAMSYERRMILIAGTGYAGEIKKSIFSFLNYTLPGFGVLSMHCSANHASGDPNDVAVFFGLSGTGKTTLSADPQRTLIGDDEHGWSDNGIFNMEGGCYAKTLHLDPVTEPEIHATTRMFATVIENMVCGPDTGEADFDDDSISANMRCAHPLEYITNSSATGLAGQPRYIVMLTCDAFGVLPPIARLTPAQAVYYFLSGFTSKTAGTERGVKEPQPTFSACFGAPFMPRRPVEYGRLLGNRIASSGASCWLVNTGWSGGAYGEGSRIPIGTTRRLLSLALDGALESAAFRKDDKFGFDVPVSVAGIDDILLRRRDTWADAAAFDRQTARLLRMFSDNFAKFERWDGTRAGQGCQTVAWRRNRAPSAAVLMLGGWPAGGIWLSTEPMDMRRSFNGLCALVSTHFGENPASVHWYVFINRRRTVGQGSWLHRSQGIADLSQFVMSNGIHRSLISLPQSVITCDLGNSQPVIPKYA